MTMDSSGESPRLPPAYRLVTFDVVESTNDEARRLAEEGAEDGTLVWAREQRMGRGRLGRKWSSPRGNLYISLVLRPDCSLGRCAELGFVAAVSLAEAIGSVAPPMIEVHYKWPNDLLLNGRKGAGILLESSLTPEGALAWLVLGIGLNIKSYPQETGYEATSLQFEGAPASLTEIELLEAFGRYFQKWASVWLEEGFAAIRRRWMAHVKGLNEEIEVRLPTETLKGHFRGLDDSGALLLEMADGRSRKISAGDVHFPQATGA